MEKVEENECQCEKHDGHAEQRQCRCVDGVGNGVRHRQCYLLTHEHTRSQTYTIRSNTKQTQREHTKYTAKEHTDRKQSTQRATTTHKQERHTSIVWPLHVRNVILSLTMARMEGSGHEMLSSTVRSPTFGLSATATTEKKQPIGGNVREKHETRAQHRRRTRATRANNQQIHRQVRTQTTTTTTSKDRKTYCCAKTV